MNDIQEVKYLLSLDKGGLGSLELRMVKALSGLAGKVEGLESEINVFKMLLKNLLDEHERDVTNNLTIKYAKFILGLLPENPKE